MTIISENKVWRIVARIDDEIIIKQAGSIEKATRSVRNAVCQRLCDAAEIEYELGWWKGRRHAARRDFVDNFIGKPLYVLLDEEVVNDLHDIPYEVYTIEQVRMTFRKMSLMTPDNIDAWGYLHWGPEETDKVLLLGEKLPIPPHLALNKGFEEEEVIALCDAQECLDECPSCKGEIPFGTLVLVTENFRLIPTNCCSKMIWLKEEANENIEGWE
ncbi:MAG: hypothetical protein HOE76_07105 [Euryarchaeota archaeon]|jgi:hypothetical protein|nr:hypothetical protein [Euryarchaeota archaeon]MBT4982091.1 hypothetical protein [Euryarchaeota archaeon]